MKLLWLWIILGILGAFIVVTAIRAAFYKPKKVDYGECIDEKVDAEKVAEHLSGAIKIKTISMADHNDVDWDEFTRFHDYLDETYPLIKEKLTKENISTASLIYRWEGTNPELEPMALLSHQDVVPVTQGTEQDWVHEPFSGDIDDEFVWGRGAVDMKNHLICVMDAVEELLKEGFKPERDVYLCFGHNEEVVCAKDDPGAEAIVNTLKERGIRLDSVIDEGGALLVANVKGIINKYLCGVGMAEKGYCDYKVTVTDKGGHTSQSPKHNGLNKLANVIKDLEGHQFHSHILPFIKEMFANIGKNCSYLGRFVLCNIWMLWPILRPIMLKIPVTACFIRTTTGVSMCEGSPAPNVLPQRASVVANFRPLPGDSVKDVEKHIRKVVRYKDIEVELLNQKEATRFSPTGSPAYNAIEKICNQMNPNQVVVAPYLVMGGTDACFYEEICTNVLRFAPFKLSIELLETTHGTNERCTITELGSGVAFFKKYIREVSKKNR